MRPSSPDHLPHRHVTRATGARRSGRHRAARRFSRIGAFTGAVALTMTVAIAALTSPLREPAVADVGGLDAAALASTIGRQVDAIRVDPGRGPARRADATDPTELPGDSGTGKRIVFDQSAQRVWLVRGNGKVRRTYEVSGSNQDNLEPSGYEVFSRSRHARAYDLKSTMDYFVRFARGTNAAIGFHDLPVDRSGTPLQSKADLGTPLSSGCIRQAHPDAVALWKFAPVGTPVVVLA